MTAIEDVVSASGIEQFITLTTFTGTTTYCDLICIATTSLARCEETQFHEDLFSLLSKFLSVICKSSLHGQINLFELIVLLELLMLSPLKSLQSVNLAAVNELMRQSVYLKRVLCSFMEVDHY